MAIRGQNKRYGDPHFDGVKTLETMDIPSAAPVASEARQRSVMSRGVLMLTVIVAYGAASVAADWWSVQPNGSNGPKDFLSAVLLCSAVAMILLQWCWFVPIRWLKAVSTFITIVALGSLLGFLPARSVGHELRVAEFEKIVKIGDEIVLAIKEFTRANDCPPASLVELVPTYIDEIPSTGHAAFPEFQFKLKTSRMTWMLFVDVAAGFDRELLAYHSETATSNGSKPLGDWTIAPKR